MSDAGFERFKELLASGIIVLNATVVSRRMLINIDNTMLDSILLNIWNGEEESMRRIGF